MESLKTQKLELEIVRRSYDDRWIVNAPISSVRIGETDKDAIKRKDCVDYLMSLSVFVGKSENECRLWVDRNKQTLVKLGTPYEVA
tara:strand:+ start:2851 stop:3108 length:258 start_codon:yes stop_codon:yes gene_type:complete